MCRVSGLKKTPPCTGLHDASLRLMRMLLGNAALRGHRVAASLLLRHVGLVGQRLLLLETLRHVVGVHVGGLLWHAGPALLRG